MGKKGESWERQQGVDCFDFIWAEREDGISLRNLGSLRKCEIAKQIQKQVTYRNALGFQGRPHCPVEAGDYKFLVELIYPLL